MSERQLPFKCEVLDQGPIKVTNPFSGESYTLEADAVAVYDVVMGAQFMKHVDWDLVRKGLDWFREYEPEAYMVLLD